jgi:outer membrane biosynthesis protein TonB
MLCLADAICPLYCLENRPTPIGQGDVLNRALSCIQAVVALAAVAVIASGCAAANNATSAQASGQGERPYKTMYGMTSEGPTTDLYTELFGPKQPSPAATTAVAVAQPVEPATSQVAVAQPVTPVQQTATAPNRTHPGPTTTASRTPQPVAPQPAPVQVAQQPAPPPPPQEPDSPTAYGIPSGGHTTDLYTAIFGPRQSSGQ